MTAAIRAVVFDIDDTLVDFTGAARSALAAAVLGRPDADPGRLPAIWDRLNDRAYGRFLSGELTFVQMRHARMRDLLAAYDPGRDWDHVAVEEHRNREIFEHYRLFDDVPPCLAALRGSGFALGVLSNSDGDYQRRKLAVVGLTGRFDAEVFSGDVGVAKPDPGIFRWGARALGLAPAACVYVGDRAVTDTQGALDAGMHAVWLNRERRPAEVFPAPAGRLAATITGLDELPALLARAA